MKDFDTDHLTSDEQRLIANTVMKVLPDNPVSGECHAFYTPAEWAKSDNAWGADSKLILFHDGGDLARFCDYDKQDYDAIAELDKALDEIGYFCQQCTSWYSAIYPNEPSRS